ncbi:hypothetical protein PaecuDRAFT_1791 [Paenibacillus curdlanolyticus YK9]|uniref:Uncharacterized protein n=1 Tax=Paenibacillus curdlanolyticus YK9 TaxID=717606 RepID=E0I840_9BACL|nr:hypothetical protein PaecuDRAFT_1791 [Paenibacillus curdlanolyticus YK9]
MCFTSDSQTFKAHMFTCGQRDRYQWIKRKVTPIFIHIIHRTSCGQHLYNPLAIISSFWFNYSYR